VARHTVHSFPRAAWHYSAAWIQARRACGSQPEAQASGKHMFTGRAPQGFRIETAGPPRGIRCPCGAMHVAEPFPEAAPPRRPFGPEGMWRCSVSVSIRAPPRTNPVVASGSRPAAARAQHGIGRVGWVRASTKRSPWYPYHSANRPSDKARPQKKGVVKPSASPRIGQSILVAALTDLGSGSILPTLLIVRLPFPAQYDRCRGRRFFIDIAR
jgi:hypothetical protein